MVIDETEYRNLARKIQMIGRLIKIRRDSELESIGLTSNQSDCLLFLDSHPGCTINDLRSYMGVTHQAASALVDRMKSAGLIETEVHDGDRRSRMIILTSKGKKVVSKIETFAVNAGHNISYGLSDPEIEELNRSLDVVLSNMIHLQSNR